MDNLERDDIQIDEMQLWDGVFEQIQTLAGTDVAISTGMTLIIELCEPHFPHEDWSALRALPYDDTTLMEEWLTGIFQREPLPENVQGLWFGLFNLRREQSEVTTDLYLSGSRMFREDDLYCEWACDPEYLPAGRYAGSIILDEIHRIAYGRRDGLCDRAEYPLCLAYGTLLIRQLLSRMDPSFVLGQAGEIGVAIGFDDGDCIVVGKLGNEGFSWVNKP